MTALMPNGEPVSDYWQRVTLEELQRRGHKIEPKEWEKAKGWERHYRKGES